MASVGRRFLHRFRPSLTSTTSPPYCPIISHSTTLFYCRFKPLKTSIKGLQPVLHKFASILRCKLCIQQPFKRNFSLSGTKLFFGSILGVSAVSGLIVYLSPRVTYAMDGDDILVEDCRVNSWRAPDLEEDSRAFWTSARKFWLPVVFFVTVLFNWDHPITLAVKVILFLLSTKPGPYSVYIFVEQLRQEYMLKKPYLYNFKSLYANKVEVNDYKILCLATVELRDQKFTLIGILGGWWVLPSSSCPIEFSVLWNRALKRS